MVLFIFIVVQAYIQPFKNTNQPFRFTFHGVVYSAVTLYLYNSTSTYDKLKSVRYSSMDERTEKVPDYL